mmetsp:Transcript_24072/g.72356  ORF Transcript_24072/g.72356 Transcript_24072/m.72356 type:complete len:276 (-) Transcript_24072:762-1589(-)
MRKGEPHRESAASGRRRLAAGVVGARGELAERGQRRRVLGADAEDLALEVDRVAAVLRRGRRAVDVARRLDAVDGREEELQRVPGLEVDVLERREALDVDDVVRQIAARRVDLLDDVDARVAKDGKNLAEHARPVLVDDADALHRVAARGERRRRKVDRIANRARLEVERRRLRRHGRRVLLGLLRGRAEVRQHDDVGSRGQTRPDGEVAHVGARRPGVVEAREGGLVHQLAAREVQQAHVLLRSFQDVRGDHALCRIHRGRVEAHVVARGHQVF